MLYQNENYANCVKAFPTVWYLCMKVRVCLWVRDAVGVVQQWELCWYRAGLDDDDEGNAFLAIGRAWGIYWVSIPLLRYSIYTHARTRMQSSCLFSSTRKTAHWMGGWCLMTFVENLERARIKREPSQSLFIQGTYDMCIYMKRSVNKSRSFIFFMNNIQLFYILYLS